jgi:hypothetical protein
MKDHTPRERELLCNWQLFSVTQSVLVSSPSVIPDQISAEIRKLRGWCHGASSLTEDGCLLYPLLESSLDLLWSLLYSTLYWSILCSTLDWSLLHLTLPGVSFARPSTGVFFTWPFLDSPLLDPLLESCSLTLGLSLVCVCLVSITQNSSL